MKDKEKFLVIESGKGCEFETRKYRRVGTGRDVYRATGMT
jgi:hypothetical protein